MHFFLHVLPVAYPNLLGKKGYVVVVVVVVEACFTSHINLPNANSSQQQTVDHWGNQQMTLVSHAKQVEMKWMNMPDYVWPHVIAKVYH